VRLNLTRRAKKLRRRVVKRSPKGGLFHDGTKNFQVGEKDAFDGKPRLKKLAVIGKIGYPSLNKGRRSEFGKVDGGGGIGPPERK